MAVMYFFYLVMHHSHPQTLQKNSVLPYPLPITLSYLSIAEYIEISHLKYLVFKQDHVTSTNDSNYLNLRCFQTKA